MEPLYTFERIALDKLEQFARKQDKAARTSEARKHMEANGFIQVSAWVHRGQWNDAMTLLQFLHSHADFTAGPARHIMTGRLRRI